MNNAGPSSALGFRPANRSRNAAFRSALLSRIVGYARLFRPWRRFRAPVALLSSVFLAACATAPERLSNRYPLPLPAAVRFLAKSLYPEAARPWRDGLDSPLVIIDPFYLRETGEAPRVSRRVETLLMDAAGAGVRVRRMSPANLREADYALNGRMFQADYRVPGREETEPYWRIQATLVDLTDGKVAAEAEVWVADQELAVEPIAIHRDSPVFFHHLPRSARSGPEYVDGLRAAALWRRPRKNTERGITPGRWTGSAKSWRRMPDP
ncbi:MAG: hypothetical protein ACLFTV_04445 [Desulfococcaceae bacterium]